MRNASGHNYRNSSFTVDVAMGQIPGSTERISSLSMKVDYMLNLYARVVSFPFLTMRKIAGNV